MKYATCSFCHLSEENQTKGLHLAGKFEIWHNCVVIVTEHMIHHASKIGNRARLLQKNVSVHPDWGRKIIIFPNKVNESSSKEKNMKICGGIFVMK
jgi:hypothetical protein